MRWFVISSVCANELHYPVCRATFRGHYPCDIALDRPIVSRYNALREIRGRAAVPESRLGRFRSYRHRAEELRTLAESMTAKGARDSLVHTAMAYEFLAQTVEEPDALSPPPLKVG